MRPRASFFPNLFLLATVSALASAQEPAKGAARAPVSPGRGGLEAFQIQLDRAVERVSLPHVAHVLGRAQVRSYRLPGYGVVFVLPPRWLPGGGLHYRVGRSPSRLELRLNRRLPPGADAPEIESLERQVVVLQNATEQTRRAAEEETERIVQQMRARMNHEVSIQVGAPEGEPESGAGPQALSLPPELPAEGERRAPVPPPWKYWFEAAAPGDERTPQAVIAEVRSAVVETLLDPAASMTGLRADEFVTVAVAFEPAGKLVPKQEAGERTLIVRARARDIAARARGTLPAEELRRRLEVIEY